MDTVNSKNHIMSFKQGDKVRWNTGPYTVREGEIIAVVAPGIRPYDIAVVWTHWKNGDAKFNFDHLGVPQVEMYVVRTPKGPRGGKAGLYLPAPWKLELIP